MEARDLQHETMRLYRTLVELRADWGGALVLCCGPQCAQTGAPSAVSIAGGATLAIDADAAGMKMALRSGYLDFVVNNLDEALRTLKNEVRQRRPLSVGLIADVDATLGEMVERGVQPDLHLVPTTQDVRQAVGYADLEALAARGMPQSVSVVRDDPEEPSELERSGKRVAESCFAAADAAALRAVDAALLAMLPADDSVRRRWVQRVPQYLRAARTGGRWVWLSEDELDDLAARELTPRPPSSAPTAP